MAAAQAAQFFLCFVLFYCPLPSLLPPSLLTCSISVRVLGRDEEEEDEEEEDEAEDILLVPVFCGCGLRYEKRHEGRPASSAALD